MGSGKYFPFTTFRLPDCPYETDIYFYNLRRSMLASALITAALTAALGCVTSFPAALVLRATTGLCDGVMMLSKSAMASISNKTNAAKAFSTFGVTYGLGSSIGPTVAALLAYPCGGDPNSSWTKSHSSPLFKKCQTQILVEYPFLLSTAWVGMGGFLLWGFAFFFMKIPEGDGEAGYVRASEKKFAESARESQSNEVEMGPVCSIAGTVHETDGTSDEEESSRLLMPAPGTRNDKKKKKTDRTHTSCSSEFSSPAAKPWHSDPNVRLATHAQVWCAFITITGAELTPIWMATSVGNGGLGFGAVEIGTFGGVMGFFILVFAATLFAVLANNFGVTTSVRAALTANGVVYLAHPLAWYSTRSGDSALTWSLLTTFALARGCAGPIVMGGVSLILNNSAPRKSLGKVNGFAGTFTNVARALAPIVGGGLMAGTVHATRTLVGGGGDGEKKNGFEFSLAEAVPPTWWPFVLFSVSFFGLSALAARLPRVLDAPRTEGEG